MKLKWKEMLPFAAIALSVLILLAGSFDALIDADGDPIVVGWKAIFGGKYLDLGILGNLTVLFSFGNFIAHFLPLIITVGAYFAGQKMKENGMISIIIGGVSVLAFLVSLILFALYKTNTTVLVEQFGTERVQTFTEASLAASPIIGMILAILGMGVSGMHTYFQIKK